MTFDAGAVGRSKKTWESLDTIYEALPDRNKEEFVELIRVIVINPLNNAITDTAFRWTKTRKH